MTSAPLLEVELDATYRRSGAGVRGVRFQLAAGELFGLAGESGSGKSTVALAILGLLPMRGGTASGTVLFRGENLLCRSDRELRRIRGKQIAYLPQNPMTALNPALRLETQFREAWLAHERSRDGWRDMAASTLRAVGLNGDREFLRRYPRELSVGIAQRVLLAMTVLHRPALLVADEPTSALDVITQSEALALFRQLSRANGMAVLLISHELLGLISLCGRIGIMSGGELVEVLPASELLEGGRHPYTRRLVAALPLPGRGAFIHESVTLP